MSNSGRRIYIIIVQGHLDPAWSTNLHNLTITKCKNGTTRLEGGLADQSALLGCLMQLRNVGAHLIRIDSYELSDR